MNERWAIGPTIGVARVGNSPHRFYLEPDGIGALPVVCDEWGNPARSPDGRYERVVHFKDPGDNGAILRQAARFRVFRFDDVRGRWVLPAPGEIEKITWTVHLANKKACWYRFSEYDGNLLLGDDHGYAPLKVKLRNPDVVGDSRRELIIDPGPRSVTQRREWAHFDLASAPATYPHAHFPVDSRAASVKTLGQMVMNDHHELVVLGGFGHAGGAKPIESFGGGDTWHDDIADGAVRCVIQVGGRELPPLTAWCIVGSPKVAPEIVNIVSLADTMEDVAIRCLKFRREVFRRGAFNPRYKPDFDREIKPILERPAAYRWVANVPVLGSVSPPPFDARDKRPANRPCREAYLSLFRAPARMPGQPISADQGTLNLPLPGADHGSIGHFPMMPLNAGSNPVDSSPGAIDKFLTLTETQYFMLQQWAAGRFTARRQPDGHSEDVDPLSLTRASMGNCVGGPFCPGIEVSWNTRNPRIYDAPFHIRHRRTDYADQGLQPGYDEAGDEGEGCEPGDLTKRMANPWQADFQECTAQYINFKDPRRNETKAHSHIPKPPVYQAHWWPPQSPTSVITGDESAAGQEAAGTPAGLQVSYGRGINSFADMIVGWKYLGFVLNRSVGPMRSLFPNFVEQHRDHAQFVSHALQMLPRDGEEELPKADFGFGWRLVPQPEHPDPEHRAEVDHEALSQNARRSARRG